MATDGGGQSPTPPERPGLEVPGATASTGVQEGVGDTRMSASDWTSSSHAPDFLRSPPSDDETELWGTTVVAGIVAGGLFGGSREAYATRDEFLHNFQAATSRFEQRELMERRLIRIMQGGIRTGTQLGVVMAIFAGTQICTSRARQTVDAWNVVAAGGVSAGAVGVTAKRGLIPRARALVTFGSLGAATALPFGLLQQWLLSVRPPDTTHDHQPGSVQRPREEAEAMSGVGAAIQRLENRFLSVHEDKHKETSADSQTPRN